MLGIDPRADASIRPYNYGCACFFGSFPEGAFFIPRISPQYFLTIALNNDKIVNRNKRIIAARTHCLCGCVHRVSPTGNTAFLRYSIRLLLA